MTGACAGVPDDASDAEVPEPYDDPALMPGSSFEDDPEAGEPDPEAPLDPDPGDEEEGEDGDAPIEDLDASVAERDAAKVYADVALLEEPDPPAPFDAGVVPPPRVDAGGIVTPSSRPPIRDLGAIRANEAAFPLGVMAGDATHERAVLWTRYLGSARLVLHVLQMDGNRAVRVAFEADVTPAPGGFVHVDVPGLRAGARHIFAFLERSGAGFSGRSRIGHFRAAIAPDALETVTFAGVSCTSQYRAATARNLGRAARRGDLSFFLHAGDQLYADHPAGHGATLLPEYHRKYAEAWSNPGHRALHAAVGTYSTWDDHEVANNWIPGRTDPVRQAFGVQAFFDHQPIRRDPIATSRLWRSFRWGRTLEVFVLDGRSERTLSPRRYLSDDQRDWLVDGLRRSPAMFKLILNSAPVGRFPAAVDARRTPDDRWESFAADRAAVLAAGQRAGGVWWLSGDFHVGAVGRLEMRSGVNRMREVLMGAGGQGTLPASVVRTMSRPQWTYATRLNSYTVFRANPSRRVLDIAFYDARRQLHTARYGLL
ncbi:MAG: Phosphodiesterase/alkaline phosphatase [Myxococcaceae bacterium]|nr:Phosphodiesterase/alkaline phosphatase [Myxococcaceae bacterium]